MTQRGFTLPSLRRALKSFTSRNPPFSHSLPRYSHIASNKLSWSYVHGPSSVPFLGVTIGKQLQNQTESNPEREALVFCKDGIRRTLSQLLDEADQLAAGLLQLGLKKGDRVGIWGPNSLEWVLTQYATARAGIILVCINPQYKGKELEYVLKKVGVSALISAPGFKDSDYYEILFSVIPELASAVPGDLHSHVLPDLRHVILMGEDNNRGVHKFSDIMQAGTTKDRRSILDLQERLQFDDPINIQFTSGTTGYPKGVTLSHHGILNNAYFIGRRLAYNEQVTRICAPVPLYHCFGLVLASLMIPAHSACVVFPSPTFEIEPTLKAVMEERCTSLYGVPTMFIDMLNNANFTTYNYATLRTGIMGGSPCPADIMRRVIEQMHMPEITVCYGLTETSPITMQSYRDSPVERRVSTVGKCSDHTESKVVNEEGELLPVNTPGELCHRGYVNMLGYWDDKGKTDDVITQDRWFHTGDIATINEEGYCKIVGRTKDMIIRGGENIYPTEIEGVLYKHPEVKDVQVVGMPDERLGEEVCACVLLKDGRTTSADDIKSFCNGKIAKFKVPKYVVFVSNFPLTTSGKVQKNKLREETVKTLGLEHIKPH